MLAFLPETQIFIVTQGEWPPKGDDMTPDGEKPEGGRRKFQAWEAFGHQSVVITPPPTRPPSEITYWL